MANLLTYAHPPSIHTFRISHFTFPIPTRRDAVVLASAVSSPERRTRRKKQQRQQNHNQNEENIVAMASSAEKGLRLVFMEELMERARERDAPGVSEVIYDMIAAGLTPGPRSFHGLVVSHALNGDYEGAVGQTVLPTGTLVTAQVACEMLVAQSLWRA